MNKEAKDMYYIAKRNMNKYIKYRNSCYHRIVGFHYDNGVTGFIVINEFGYRCVDVECNWGGINKIFLNNHAKRNYRYLWILYPDEHCKIIDNI